MNHFTRKQAEILHSLFTREELHNLANALRCKARGDREAAQRISKDSTVSRGICDLGLTLVAQAGRQETLADKIENVS